MTVHSSSDDQTKTTLVVRECGIRHWEPGGSTGEKGKRCREAFADQSIGDAQTPTAAMVTDNAMLQSWRPLLLLS